MEKIDHKCGTKPHMRAGRALHGSDSNDDNEENK